MFGWWAGFRLRGARHVAGLVLVPVRWRPARRLWRCARPNWPRPRPDHLRSCAIVAIPLLRPVLQPYDRHCRSRSGRGADQHGSAWRHPRISIDQRRCCASPSFSPFRDSDLGLVKAGTRQEFQMMVVAIVLVVFNVVFWTLFEQAGSSLTLFADRNTDRASSASFTLSAGSDAEFQSDLRSWFWRRLFSIALELAGETGHRAVAFRSSSRRADPRRRGLPLPGLRHEASPAPISRSPLWGSRASI